MGAGCSAAYGYPLGQKLGEELKSFAAKVPDGSSIKVAVNEAIDLTATFPHADTLDKLVKLSNERFKAFRSARGPVWEKADTDQESLMRDQVLSAKIATAALFLDKEQGARKTMLEGYKNYLLPSIFGRGSSCQSAVNDSDCSVLTFNYDRLFEIAFLDYFKDSEDCSRIEQFPLYGKSILNSGFYPTLDWRLKRIDVEPDRFCFLKLHGSAGWWAKICETNPKEKWRDYWPGTPHVPTDLAQLEEFLAGNKQFDKWEPLIVFPHEKQLSTSDPLVEYVQSPYTDKIWKHAARLLGEATEVIVIGYSFAEIDREHMLEKLLRKTPRTTRIKIENKEVGSVQRALEGFSDLQDRLEFVTRVF